MSALPSNFNTLPPLAKRRAIEAATGLSWAQYSSLPMEVRLNMLDGLKGNTVSAVVSEMQAAAKVDALTGKLSGFLSGFKVGTTGAVVIAGAAILYGAYTFRKPLKKALS